MGYKRLIQKTLMGGGLDPISAVIGHLEDAYHKKKVSGKSYSECLKDSVKETLYEDLPGTSHIYKAGHKDVRKKGIAEQAARDAKKIQDMNRLHKRDRENWRRTQQGYEDLLDDISKS